MDPATALDRQIAAYRGMTGERRLTIAFNLHRLACDLAREGIRAQFPDAGEEEVERLLRARIELGRRAVPPSAGRPTHD